MNDETPSAGHEQVDIPLHQLLRLEFSGSEPGSGTGEVRMPVRPEAFGFTANLHGGAIATMIDVACALAAVSMVEFDPALQSLVTTDMHVRYLGRPRTSEVIARADVVRSGRQLTVVNCVVADSDGHVIASGDFSMMIVSLRRPLVSGMDTVPGSPEL